jgi:hypothetical protein
MKESLDKLVKNIADRVYRYNKSTNNGKSTDKNLIRSVIEAGGYDADTITEDQKTEIFNTVIAQQSAPVTAIAVSNPTPTPASQLTKSQAVGIVFESLNDMSIDMPMNQIGMIAEKMISMQLSSIDAVNHATAIINEFIAEGERRFNETLSQSMMGIAQNLQGSNSRMNAQMESAYSSMQQELSSVDSDFKSSIERFKSHVTASFKN